MANAKNVLGKFKKHCQLGSVYGGRGSVWSMTDTSTSKRYAVKVYPLDDLNDEFLNIQEEIQKVRQLCHKNIVSYLSVVSHGQIIWIFMPLYGYTSISRVVATHFNSGLSENALCLIARDVLQALSYLHCRGIIHRSIRGSHILVGTKGHCVLTGFRNSISAISQGQWEKPMHDYPSDIASELNWASPELLRQDLEGYTEKTDIYSLGITICELGNGEVPFCRLEAQLLLVEKNYGREAQLLDVNTCRFIENAKDSGMGESYGDYVALLPAISNKEFSSKCHGFVGDCVTLQQEDRPSADKLLAHNFIRYSRKISQTLPQLLHPVTPIHDEDSSDVDLLQKFDDISLSNEESDESWDF